MHFAKCSEILAALRVQFFFHVYVTLSWWKREDPVVTGPGSELSLTELAAGSWAAGMLWGVAPTAQAVLQSRSLHGLAAAVSRARRGAGFLFRKLVEKDEKQSFPVGEQSGIKRSGVQFELAYLEEYGQCEKTSESKPIVEGSFTLQNNFN